MLGVIVERARRRAVVILKNFPCAWGKCVFCPFSLEAGRSLEDVLKTNDEVLALLSRALQEHDVDRITVFNGGSFFELPLDTVVKLSEHTSGREVDVETRPEYLTRKSVLSLLELLKPRRLWIRVGVEVWDERLRNEVLRKGIPQRELERLSALRSELRRELGGRVGVLAYVLFGIEGLPEDKVVESVERLGELFDGVIAIKYKRVLPHHPPEAPVSDRLISFLKSKCLDVDLGEGAEWEFTGEVRYVVV